MLRETRTVTSLRPGYVLRMAATDLVTTLDATKQHFIRPLLWGPAEGAAFFGALLRRYYSRDISAPSAIEMYQ